ncbi:MAG: cytochrome c-type biogenesis protein CcmH [Gaiellaceae bacterium]
MIARVFALAALALVLTTPALGAGSGFERREAQLENRVMCPTCHQLLALSHSPIAQRMRAFIRAQLAGGKSEGQIERELVAQFGPAVLAEPPVQGFGLLAWLVPAAGVAAAAGAVFMVARAWRRRAPADVGDVSPELLRRIERELLALDD